MVRIATNQTPHGLPTPSATPTPTFPKNPLTVHIPYGVDFTGYHGTKHMHGSDGLCYYLADDEQRCSPQSVKEKNLLYQNLRRRQTDSEEERSESDDEDLPVQQKCQHCRLVHVSGSADCVSSPEESEDEKPNNRQYTRENPKVLGNTGAVFYFEQNGAKHFSLPSGRTRVWPAEQAVSKFSPESSDDESTGSQDDDCSETASLKSDDSDKENKPPKLVEYQTPAGILPDRYPDGTLPRESFASLMSRYDLSAGPADCLVKLQQEIDELQKENADQYQYVLRVHECVMKWKQYAESTDETLDDMIDILQNARDLLVNSLGDFSPRLREVVEQSPLQHQPEIAAQVFSTLVNRQASLIKVMQRKLKRKSSPRRSTSRRGLLIWEDLPGTYSCRDMLKQEYSQKAVLLNQNLRFFRGRLQTRRYSAPVRFERAADLQPEDC